MKRASDDTRVILRQYGGTIRHWPSDADVAMLQMCQLWNRCVEIERAHVGAVRAATAENPEVAALDAEIKALEAERDELIAKRRNARKVSRSRSSDSAVIATRLTAIRDLLKPLYERRKPTAQAAREAIKEQLKTLSETRNAAVKEARIAARDAGLYWGNYNEVMQRFDASASRCRKTGDELRFQRPNGEGTLAVQVMPPVMVEEFVLPAPAAESGDVSHSGLPAPPAERGDDMSPPTAAWLAPLGNGRALVGLNVLGPQSEGGQVQAVLDIDYHRPLPANAEVVYVRLTRRRTGQHYGANGLIDRWTHTVTITCRTREMLPQSKPGMVVGIDVGWRRMTDGLRVAVAAWQDGAIEELRMPEKLLERHAAIRATKSRADQATDLMWAVLLQDPPGEDAPEALADAWSGEMAFQARSRKRTHKGLKRLLAAWPKEYRPETWMRLDKWAWLHHRRLSDLWRFRNRTHQWARELRRVWALGIIRRARHVVIEDLDLKGMKTKVKKDGTESELANEHRRLSAIAGCGELLAWLKWKALEHGAKITEHAGKSTWHCHHCGVEHKPLKPEELWHKCRACGTGFDQDVNASLNLLAIGTTAGVPRAAE